MAILRGVLVVVAVGKVLAISDYLLAAVERSSSGFCNSAERLLTLLPEGGV